MALVPAPPTPTTLNDGRETPGRRDERTPAGVGVAGVDTHSASLARDPPGGAPSRLSGAKTALR